MLDASCCHFEGNVCCGERSFSTCAFAINTIERDHVTLFVEEEVVLPVRHDEFIGCKHLLSQG